MSDLQSKTDEELNVMLAELAGWTDFKYEQVWAEHPNDRRDAWTARQPDMIGACVCEIPDYCSSLDTVAKVEAGLTDEQQVNYAKILWDSVGPTSDFKGSKGFWHVSFKHATAQPRQRTIALIQTLTP